VIAVSVESRSSERRRSHVTSGPAPPAECEGCGQVRYDAARVRRAAARGDSAGAAPLREIAGPGGTRHPGWYCSIVPVTIIGSTAIVWKGAETRDTAGSPARIDENRLSGSECACT
jgi:hypothetical protein